MVASLIPPPPVLCMLIPSPVIFFLPSLSTQLADPFVAAEDFLSTNNLPVYYLDQVAEFIIKNAGDYQGAVESTQGDPFTGESHYMLTTTNHYGDTLNYYVCLYVHMSVMISCSYMSVIYCYSPQSFCL